MAKWFWAGALSIVVVASLVAPTRWRTPLAALAAACALALAWRPRTKAAVQQERYPKQYVARRGIDKFRMWSLLTFAQLRLRSAGMA